ncbi:MAG: hypothetical protein ACOYJ2_08555 [Rickettsiales bacterium]
MANELITAFNDTAKEVASNVTRAFDPVQSIQSQLAELGAIINQIAIIDSGAALDLRSAASQLLSLGANPNFSALLSQLMRIAQNIRGQAQQNQNIEMFMVADAAEEMQLSRQAEMRIQVRSQIITDENIRAVAANYVNADEPEAIRARLTDNMVDFLQNTPEGRAAVNMHNSNSTESNAAIARRTEENAAILSNMIASLPDSSPDRIYLNNILRHESYYSSDAGSNAVRGLHNRTITIDQARAIFDEIRNNLAREIDRAAERQSPEASAVIAAAGGGAAALSRADSIANDSERLERVRSNYSAMIAGTRTLASFSANDQQDMISYYTAQDADSVLAFYEATVSANVRGRTLSQSERADLEIARSADNIEERVEALQRLSGAQTALARASANERAAFATAATHAVARIDRGAGLSNVLAVASRNAAVAMASINQGVATGNWEPLAEQTGRNTLELLHDMGIRGFLNDQRSIDASTRQYLDVDGNGTVSLEEFKQRLMTDNNFSYQQMAGLSGNGNHREITYNEFRATIGFMETEADINRRYAGHVDSNGRKIFDGNGDGQITLNELRSALQRTGVSLDNFSHITDESELITTAMNQAIARSDMMTRLDALERAGWNDMIVRSGRSVSNLFDTNNDNQLTIEEVTAAMARYNISIASLDTNRDGRIGNSEMDAGMQRVATAANATRSTPTTARS